MRFPQPIIINTRAEVLGQYSSCIVPAWQHESMKKVLNGRPLSGL